MHNHLFVANWIANFDAVKKLLLANKHKLTQPVLSRRPASSDTKDLGSDTHDRLRETSSLTPYNPHVVDFTY